MKLLKEEIDNRKPSSANVKNLMSRTFKNRREWNVKNLMSRTFKNRREWNVKNLMLRNFKNRREWIVNSEVAVSEVLEKYSCLRKLSHVGRKFL